ncbi:hypothetical protein Poli38472_009017 [Pythium oligandrum]|uniref:Uncharacterized protein n=1 Tax=Pythium oligandrum TaxID=41045 RepID=A0A8K1CLH9_PYTOL|nr:hypothetical protein Poli38472_009017 [Pythium oligandrum]|eukprot:TMW64850.1 hypothetical protein Poli38472_009017 [Pythium oligandrum]
MPAAVLLYLQQKNMALKSQLQAAVDSQMRLRVTVKTLEAEKTAAREATTSVETKYVGLRASFEILWKYAITLKSEAKAWETQKAERDNVVKALRASVATLTDKVSALEGELASMKVIAQEQKQAVQAAACAEAKNEQLRRAVEDMQLMLAQVNEEKVKRTVALQKLTTKHMVVKHMLQQSITEAVTFKEESQRFKHKFEVAREVSNQWAVVHKKHHATSSKYATELAALKVMLKRSNENVSKMETGNEQLQGTIDALRTLLLHSVDETAILQEDNEHMYLALSNARSILNSASTKWDPWAPAMSYGIDYSSITSAATTVSVDSTH